LDFNVGKEGHMTDFQGQGSPLSSDGFNAACAAVGTGAAEIWAVVSVETSGCGFLPDRRPKILFERHVFSRLTEHRFDIDDPDVSQPTPGGYGLGGAHQYDRLGVAIGLDREAALQSASWGLGQIMGENFAAAGFDSVDDMVAAMVGSENGQFQAMAAFLKANGWDAPLRDHDWAGFARRYNGPNYAAHNYDGLLQHFYTTYSSGPAPDFQVRAAQIYLTYKGFSPGGIDGIMGNATAAAIRRFQQSIGVPQTGAIDGPLMAQLAA
jgi:hypothetical protein